MRTLTIMLTLAAALALGACEKKDGANDDGKSGGDAPAENIVETEIPDEMQAKADEEITEENADEVAAELEKEIDADGE